MDLDFSEYIGIECPEEEMNLIGELQDRERELVRLLEEVREQIRQEQEIHYRAYAKATDWQQPVNYLDSEK